MRSFRVSTTVREFVTRAFAVVGYVLQWRGQGVEEVGFVKEAMEGVPIITTRSRTVVRVDPQYFRPTEVDVLIGNADKARRDDVHT